MTTTLRAPLGIGDKVYILVGRDATTYIQCPWCGTSGKIAFTTPDGIAETTPCPKCGGKGKLKAGKSATVYDVKRKEVVGVTLQAGAVDYNGKCEPVTYVLSGVERMAVKTEAGSDWRSPSGYISTIGVYWLSRADAEAVAARLSDKGAA